VLDKKTLSYVASRPHGATARVFNFDIRFFFDHPEIQPKFHRILLNPSHHHYPKI
jgi:hypothetical protein